jgi:DNA gyrase/topoisomerase IV subunit A
LTQLKEEFGDARRTKIVKSFSDYTSTQEEDKSYYVVLTNKNLKLVDKIKNLAEGKTLYKTYFQAKSNDYIWIILKTGELVQTKVIDIPNTQINNIVDIFPVSDKILLTITSDGFLKKTEFSKLISGKNLFSEKHTIVKNLLISDTEDEVVTIATKSGGITRFKPNCKTSGVNTKGIQISSIINDEIIDVQVSLESEDKNNSCLILAKADNYFYKVVPMSSILIKGRTAKTLNYITNKEKPELFKIYINQSPQYYDMKNDLIAIEQYKTKQRLEKMDILKGVPNTFEVNQL